MKVISPFTVSVVIPTYRPGEEFEKLIERLMQQSLLPDEILIVNTDREQFVFPEEKLPGRSRVIHIAPEEFDHGGTRAMAVEKTSGDIIVFMTQDAVPADRKMLEYLTECFEDPLVGAAYARQIPKKGCSALELYTRKYNYGLESYVRSAEDIPVYGIRTFFCSDVCAAWRRSAYEDAGGFETRTLFNEDMILAGHLLQKNWKIAYCSMARVIHSHNYTGMQQLRRNFDLGVSQAQHEDVFGDVRSEGEGIRLVRKTAAWLILHGRIHLLPELIWQSGCKFAGYRLGKAYRKLPAPVIRHLTSNRAWWKKNGAQGTEEEKTVKE